MRELYVYYRVRPGAEGDAAVHVNRLHEGLVADHPGLSARLLRRADTPAEARPGAAQTWMEIYALPGTSGGVSAALQDAIEVRAAVLAPFLDGGRHVEAFIEARASGSGAP
jgi:hypothetical protein